MDFTRDERRLNESQEFLKQQYLEELQREGFELGQQAASDSTQNSPIHGRRQAARFGCRFHRQLVRHLPNLGSHVLNTNAVKLRSPKYGIVMMKPIDHGQQGSHRYASNFGSQTSSYTAIFPT